MRNEIYLDLRINNFDDITHDDLTRLIGINPIKIHVKGERKNPKNPDSPLIKMNNWLINSGLDKYASFEDHLGALLNIIESKIEIFRSLCEKHYCEFVCAFFVYCDNGESTPWIHLDKRYNNLIKELNIEFDLDLYVFPTDDTDK